MKEIIEMVRPLVPPGFEITESMIASFLGSRRGRQPARGGPEVLQGAVGQVQGAPEGSETRREAARSAAAEGRLVRAVVLLPPGRAHLQPGLLDAAGGQGRGEGEVGDHRRVARGDDLRRVRRARRGEDRRVPEGGRRAGQHQARDAPRGCEVGQDDAEADGRDAEADAEAEGRRRAPTRSRRRWLAFSDKELQGKGFADVDAGSSTRRSATWRSAGFVPFGDTTPPAAHGQGAARRAGAVGR